MPQPTPILSRLDALARNLWWTWNPDAQALFASMDPALWRAMHHNPIKTMRLLAPERRGLIEGDAPFAQHLARIERALRDYLNTKTWFEKRARTRALIAYFCAEFAVHESIPQYSGGLGVLAGDHLKSASDLGIPLVAIGLLYRCGFYTQQLAADGTTRIVYPQLDFADLPISETRKIIVVPMGNRSIRARVWKQQVGRTSLYLLDTDIRENGPTDRALTRHLYGGDREYRIRQEMLLGVGGVIALEALGLKPTVYHLNEGHAAFATLERWRRLVKRGMSIDNAKRAVRGSTVFTTHTPVPAGNDRFVPKLALKYIAPLGRGIGLSNDDLLALGREDPENDREEFCMTVLALKLSARCNGVAALHGDTSRRMWTKVYGLRPKQHARVPIGHVTNGVHSQTWLAPEMRPLYQTYLRPKWNGAGPDDDWWRRADRIPPKQLWEMRKLLRSRLVRFARQRLLEQAIRRHASEQELVDAQRALDDRALTIGFARRFATYKRGTLVFHDPKRLARILSSPDRPVQLIFAGKAHPADLGGQALAKQIFQLSRELRFLGRVVILEDYDMELGRMLTSGCDVWLNNPLRPQEASGTSGMKPPLHGGINCSILDGWWPEAFNGRNGWAIGSGAQLADQSRQDARDAGAIYQLVEKQIVPEFYSHRDRNGVPQRWVARMVASMKTVCNRFSSHRMLAEYWRDYYEPSHRSGTTNVPARRG
jgi:starch phosphorylase